MKEYAGSRGLSSAKGAWRAGTCSCETKAIDEQTWESLADMNGSTLGVGVSTKLRMTNPGLEALTFGSSVLARPRVERILSSSRLAEEDRLCA